jgi:hypothetical protein
VRISHRLSVLLIICLSCFFMEPAWVTGQGWWGYGNGYNWPYQAENDQYYWYMEAHDFMNYCDPGYHPYGVHMEYHPPAYSMPAYNAAPYNMPTNNTHANNTLTSIMPTHSMPTHSMPTYSMPAYNLLPCNENRYSPDVISNG